MPTSFTTVTDGQLSDADQLNQYGPPINALETLLGNLSAPELSYLLGVTSAIQAQLDAKAALSHTHLISQLSDWPAGLTITELGYLDGVTSAIQAQLDAKASSSALTSGLAGKSDTSHNHSLTSLTGWPVGLTLIELGYLDGVTSAIQAQLDAKAALSHTHTISQLSDWPAGLTVLELGYLDGVTSAIQGQLNGKAATSHTHNASEITAGTIATARLGSGTADSTTFLCGDQTYKTVSGGATNLDGLSDVAITSAATGQSLFHNGTNFVNRALVPGDIATGTASSGYLPTANGSGGIAWAAPAAAAVTACVCQAYKSSAGSNQSISAATYTDITFDAEFVDTNSIHDNSTNTARFTVPTGKDGKWRFTGMITLVSMGSAAQFYLNICKNGTRIMGLADATDGTTNAYSSMVSGVFDLVATDYLTLQIYSGVGLTLYKDGALLGQSSECMALFERIGS